MNLDWIKDAVCRGMDHSIFFPRQMYWTDLEEHLVMARKICNGCPVFNECLEYALALPALQAQGIWAGTTERERRKLRRIRALRVTGVGTAD